MLTFSWKPALLARRVEITVDPAGLTMRRGGRTKRIDFASVQSAYLHVIAGGQGALTMLTVQFVAGDEKVVDLGVARIATKPGDREQFALAATAALMAFSTARPDAQVVLGPSRKSNIRSAAMYLAFVLVFGTVYATAHWPLDKTEIIAYPAIFVFMLGYGAIRFNPNREWQRVTAHAAIEELSRQVAESD